MSRISETKRRLSSYRIDYRLASKCALVAKFLRSLKNKGKLENL